jgi:hypothetical protein
LENKSAADQTGVILHQFLKMGKWVNEQIGKWANFTFYALRPPLDNGAYSTIGWGEMQQGK